ncbi:hypothetical protein D9758_016982 [Tetrapyrgos nigripes]|uniref:NACHT domain-containing protein n=1 Tax=Tetrapyrgos nigripes TaxID=182062 RepID=A0A8H5FI83_9AGAR|nr:hypothetical protein D9758_016982 [Tetrapyrgos nigripes]
MSRHSRSTPKDPFQGSRNSPTGLGYSRIVSPNISTTTGSFASQRAQNFATPGFYRKNTKQLISRRADLLARRKINSTSLSRDLSPDRMLVDEAPNEGINLSKRPDNSDERLSLMQSGEVQLPPPSLNFFPHASNFCVGTINNAGRDIVQTTNNYMRTDEGMEMLRVLKEKLNPIAKPARKKDTCLEGTRVKILNDLCNGVTEANTTIVWIYGIAGSGKSAIAVSLAHKIRKIDTKKEVKLALTFHCVKGQETSDICNLVPTLSYHLAQVFPEYGKGLLESLNRDPSLDGTSLSLSAQLELFLDPSLLGKLINKSSEKVVIIIIDGLDEWGSDSDRSELLRHFKALFQFAWLKIVVTSRPNPEIREELMGEFAIRKINLTDYTDTADDLKRLIMSKLPFITNEKVNNMLAKANGLFIWVTTALTFIRKGVDKDGRLEIILDLQTGTKDELQPYEPLYLLYKTVLTESFSQPDNLKYLKAVVGAILASVAYSPDGRHVVSGSSDYTIRIWDIQTGQQVGESLEGHRDGVHSVAFSPDGRHVVSGSNDNTVRIWDVQTGQQFGEPLKGHTKRVWSVAYSPDSRHVVSGSADYTIRIWDIQTGQQVGEPLEGHTDEVNSVAFSPDSRHVGSGSDDNTVRIWDMQTRQQVGEPLKGHTEMVWSVAFSPDGRHGVSGSDDETIKIWDIQTCQQVGEPLKGHTKIVRIWDIQTFQQFEEPQQLSNHTDAIRSVAFSPDGRHVVSVSDDHTIRIWDMQTCQQVGKPLKGHTDWDMQTCQQVGKPLEGHKSFVLSVAFSSDGRHVVSGSADGTIRIWDMQTCKVGKPLEGHPDWVRSVAFSPDGRHVVSGSEDRTIRIWDMQTCQQVGEPLEGHTDWVTSVAFSPDGRHVVSGSNDRTIRIWDMQTCQQVGEPLEGHTDWVRSVAFSPDGRHVVSGSDDRTIRIWDMQTCQQVGEPLEGHTNWVWSVAFSPDGRHVVSGSWDKTVRIWNIDPSNPNLIPASISQYNKKNQSCSINPQGWLCTAEPEPKLILWIPPHLRFGFNDLRRVGTIPADAKNSGVKADWSKFVCGENWTSVWNDNPEDEE